MSQTPGSQPLGKQRSIGKWILLAIVTLGIATYFWTFVTHDELQQYRRQGLGAGLGFIIYFLFGPATFFILPTEIAALYTEDGRPAPFSWKIGLWFLLPLVGSIIWFMSVQGALNDFWGSKGVPAS